MTDAEHAAVLRRLLRIDKNFPMGGDPMIDCERAAIERAIEVLDPTPDLIDLVRELREVIGLPFGALNMTPKAAWDEAIRRVRLVDWKF